MTEIVTGEGKLYLATVIHLLSRRLLGVTQSMGRADSCFDNAVSEAFNSVLKVEYIHTGTPSSPAPKHG